MISRLFIALCLFLNFTTLVFGASYKVKKLLGKLSLENDPYKKTLLYIDIANEIKGSNPDSGMYYFHEAASLSRNLPNSATREIVNARVMIGKASVEIARGNLDAAWVLDSLALRIARKFSSPEQEAAALMSQGSIFYNRSQFDRAQKCNEEALRIIRTTSDWKTEGKILTNMGTIEFMYGNSAKADSLFRIPLKLAKAANDEDLLAASLLNIGLLNVYLGKYALAEDLIRQSAVVYQKIDGKDGLVLCYQNLSNIWMEQGNLGKAIDYNMLNLNISIELADKLGIGKAYQNLGECYAQIGDYEQAISFFIKGLEIKTALGNSQEIAITNSSIGHMHYQQGDFKRALEYYRKSLSDFKRIDYASGLASSYSDIGIIMTEQNKPDSALYYFKMAEDIHARNQHQNYLAAVYMHIGKVYLTLKNYSLAEQYYHKAETIKIQVGDKLGLYNVWGLLASMHFSQSELLPDQRKSELNVALRYAQKAFSLADSMKHMPGQRESAGYLMDIWSGLGNNDQAIRFARIKLDLSDSLSRKQRAEALVNAEIRWKAERKQIEINRLVEERALQAKVIEQQSALTTRLIIILIAIIVVLGFSVVVRILYVKNRNRLKDIEFQKHLNEITRLKMQNLNNRLSPHLFFNMLGTVSGDAGDPIKVKQQVHSVTNLLRMSLENAERTAISLTEEFDMVKSYVELQRGRIPQPFTAEFHVAGNVDQSMLIPSMMVQIPVENAIKHGLMPFDGEKKLSVLIEKKDEAIVIAIEDNGVGREKSKGRTAGTGTGLKVLLQTIVLLNQRNKEKISFRISDRDPSGTAIQIIIPLNYSYQLQS